MAVEFEKNNKDRLPYLHYLERYAAKDPAEIAERCRVAYDAGTQRFAITLLGQRYTVRWPDLDVVRAEGEGFCPLDQINAKILLLRYFVDGSYTPASGKYLSYRDMPWGEVYIQQFSGRCINRFAFTFARRTADLERAMAAIGARRIQDGDFGYEVEFMDGLFLRFTLWLADDEFPPSAQILFSDNFALAFTAEDMAVVGDVTIGMLGKL